MSKFVIVNFWWGKTKKVPHMKKGITYETLADKLANRCEELKIESDIVYKKEFESTNYQENLGYKPTFIKKMIFKHKKPVLYIDVDMSIEKYPTLFNALHDLVDFSAFNWNADTRVCNIFDPQILETASGLLYFGATQKAINLCKLWEQKMKLREFRKAADDRVLAMVFHEHKMLTKMRCFWFPFEYFYIPEFFKNRINEKNVVISHRNQLTTEEEAHEYGAFKNRIPKKYTLEKFLKTKQALWDPKLSAQINKIMKHYLEHAISKKAIIYLKKA